jgi:HK97 family phage prohead protease
MELKALPHFTKSIEGRTVTGVFAVHGNVDSGFDRSHPGSFAKTIAEGAGRFRFLWQHDMGAPPIAKIESVIEVGRDQLPDAVLMKAPDATGGVEITRRYLETARAEEVLIGLKEGALNEMSYAYDPVKFDFEDMGGQKVRNLREVRMYEASDVNWGMNAATTAAKSYDIVLARLADLLNGLKAGARHSASDMALLNQIAENAISLGANTVKLITADETPKTEPQAATPAPAELISLRDRMQLFRIRTA